jgi:hypothetical protein
MINFTYEDDIEIKNKHVAGISITFYLPIEAFRRPPQSRETIHSSSKFIIIIMKKIYRSQIFI